MKISVAHTPPTTIPYGKTCIVIDVLRATSVIAVLLDLGVKEIYPTATIEEARSLKQFLKTSNEQVLLLGERDGLPPEGFDHGNSPTALIDNPSVPLIAVQATTNGLLSNGLLSNPEQRFLKVNCCKPRYRFA